jgi:hypothetical protein
VDQDEVAGAVHAHEAGIDHELVGGVDGDGDKAIAFGDAEGARDQFALDTRL